MYDIHYQPQPVLVPRRLRLGIRERILPDGTVVQPLQVDDLASALETFRAEGVEAIAICFLSAYVHPQHELEAEAALRGLGFEGAITLSHRLSRELHEFERTATSVVDAYVRPAVADYLRRLDAALRADGFAGDSLITRSGGGSLSFGEAEERPFETVMSGPVAGAVGAGALARDLGLSRAITADVGGTSFDTCLLIDGRPLLKHEGVVGDLPLQTPWIDVRSIGSGGGSIAYVDDSALLRVGPESSGANPGPVCYGRGGTSATTTDAAATLGMLAFGELAGGLHLDFASAEAAIDELAARLELARDQTGSGVIRIAAAAMAGAVRSVTLEVGEDPRDAALMAFGGAGPMLAVAIAQELDITTIVVPEHAGNFSAASLLSQDVTRSTSVTLVRPLDADGIAAAFARIGGLRSELEERAAASAVDAGERTLEVTLALRYQGQFHSLAIAWPDPAQPADATALAHTFVQEYERVYGHTIEMPVELVSVRATLREPLPDRGSAAAPAGDSPAPADRTREAYSLTLDQRVPFTVRDRARLTAEPSDGPLIVLEPTTTTYVDVGWTARIGERDALMITKKETTR
jgi:N-methylhydantoinase A